MWDLIQVLAERRGGYFFRADAIDAGCADADLRVAMRSGLLTRLRHGTYASSATVNAMTPEQKHVLTARSVLDRLGEGVVLSHHSAALAYAPQSYDIDLDEVHVTRLDGRCGRREAGVVYHLGRVNDDEVVERDGLRLTRPERAAFESATLGTTESGLVVVNAVARATGTLEQIAEEAERLERWPRGRHARIAIRLADPGCESVGESRSMFMFWKQGVPRPTTQVQVLDERGDSVARVDFEWEDAAHVGEFDGLVKYGRLNPHSGDRVGDVLVAEKRREDLVRSHRNGVSRWIWSDLDPSVAGRTAARILADLARSRSHRVAG